MVKVKCNSASLDWRGKKFVAGKEATLTSAADCAAARLCPDLTIVSDDRSDVSALEAGAKEPPFPGSKAPPPEPPPAAPAVGKEDSPPPTPQPPAPVVSPPAAAEGVVIRRGPGRPPKTA